MKIIFKIIGNILKSFKKLNFLTQNKNFYY